MPPIIGKALNHTDEQGDTGDRAKVDVTTTLQIAFNNADRNIINASVISPKGKESLHTVIQAGLRSTLLDPFEKFENLSDSTYQPCDIPGLVPGLALLVSWKRGLDFCGITQNKKGTGLLMCFETECQENSGTIGAFMNRWRVWTSILMDTVRKDPALADWPDDKKQFEDMLREFLAGETGYVTMPWYSPIELSNRAVVLDRIVEAAKAFLASVLTEQQSSHPQILSLKKWLHELKPQPEVISLASVTCKLCRQHMEGTT